MLVVNAAVAARRAGHDVVIYTSHHDEGRCFKETTGQGANERLKNRARFGSVGILNFHSEVVCDEALRWVLVIFGYFPRAGGNHDDVLCCPLRLASLVASLLLLQPTLVCVILVLDPLSYLLLWLQLTYKVSSCHPRLAPLVVSSAASLQPTAVVVCHPCRALPSLCHNIFCCFNPLYYDSVCVSSCPFIASLPPCRFSFFRVNPLQYDALAAVFWPAVSRPPTGVSSCLLNSLFFSTRGPGRTDSRPGGLAAEASRLREVHRPVCRWEVKARVWGVGCGRPLYIVGYPVWLIGVFRCSVVGVFVRFCFGFGWDGCDPCSFGFLVLLVVF